MSTIRILLVDENQHAAENLQHLGLKFDVDVISVETISDMWRQLRAARMNAQDAFDLLVWMQYRVEQISDQFCQTFYYEFPHLPLILIAPHGESHHAISCLERGAADFITGEISPRELIARFKAMHRVNTSQHAPRPQEVVTPAINRDHFVCSAFEANFRSRTVIVDGVERRLSTTQNAILRVFADNPNTALTRDDIMHQAYARPRRNSRCVDAQVTQLRRLIEAKSNDPRVLQTVWGVGYRLSVDL